MPPDTFLVPRVYPSYNHSVVISCLRVDRRLNDVVQQFTGVKVMASNIESMYARQLEERKLRLEEAASMAQDPQQIRNLLSDVDRALDKVSAGTYGLCETCHESIEPERLAYDPLTRYCIDHLSETEQHALERDIALARQLQTALLPKKELALPGWESAYHYEASGQVSGDYCDLIIPTDDAGSFYFIVGDVTGKGIAASMLMSQLHAMFRTLAGTGLPLNGLMERTNRLFCEASLTTHFATLVCGIAHADGGIEVSNAGHCLPLVFRPGGVEELSSSGLPLGVACDGKYESAYTKLRSGESILLYTDGFTESAAASGELYGEERIVKLLATRKFSSPSDLISTCLDDINSFTGSVRRTDDLTIMAIRKK